MLASIAALVLAIAQPNEGPAASQAAASVREARRIALTVSPDLYVLHAQQYADMLGALALRLTGNLTSRVALTASAGGLPNLLRAYDLGVRLYALEGALTPYGGVDVGLLERLSEDSADSTDTLVLAVLGVGFATRAGFELAADAAAGWQDEARYPSGQRDSLLFRFSVRIGYRFGF